MGEQGMFISYLVGLIVALAFAAYMMRRAMEIVEGKTNKEDSRMKRKMKYLGLLAFVVAIYASAVLYPVFMVGG